MAQDPLQLHSVPAQLDHASVAANPELFSGQHIAVIGLGAWGTTLAYLAEKCGHTVIGWSRSQVQPLAKVVTGANVIISALPVKGVRGIAEQIAALPLFPDTILVSATKGLELGTTKTAAEIWQDLLPQIDVVVLSGPNLSAEINQGLPAATVVAGDPQVTARIQAVLGSSSFRIYTNSDRTGVELGGVLKNVMAIACGVSDGLNLGVNARSALITRGLVEMIRVGTYWGGQTATFYGLSGLGDLLATCTSDLSRNYQVGWGLAQGKSLDQVLHQLVGTPEGVNTAPSLAAYAARQGLEVPITQEVCALLSGQRTPAEAISGLINRPFKPEL